MSWSCWCLQAEQQSNSKYLRQVPTQVPNFSQLFMYYILYISWSSQWKQKLFLLGLGHRKPPLLGWTPCWRIKAAIKTDRRSYWVWLAPLALLWSKLHVPHWPLHQCILWGQCLLWSLLRVPENPIMHALCQLTQLYNRNHAAHWILGGYCRRTGLPWSRRGNGVHVGIFPPTFGCTGTHTDTCVFLGSLAAWAAVCS